MDRLRKNGEPLFKAYSSREDPHRWKYNAWFWPTWDVYAIGYKEAAYLVVNSPTFTSSIDIYVYPVMFLYRQYIELQMKEIIDKGKRQVPDSTHDLNALWKELRLSLEERWGLAEDRLKLDDIGKWIGELPYVPRQGYRPTGRYEALAEAQGNGCSAGSTLVSSPHRIHNSGFDEMYRRTVKFLGTPSLSSCANRSFNTLCTATIRPP